MENKPIDETTVERLNSAYDKLQVELTKSLSWKLPTFTIPTPELPTLPEEVE